MATQPPLATRVLDTLAEVEALETRHAARRRHPPHRTHWWVALTARVLGVFHIGVRIERRDD